MDIKNLLNKFLSKEFIRFCLVGFLATAINYGVYYLCLLFFSPTVAYSIGYAVSFVFNFCLSAKFTFRKAATIRKGIGFALSHLVNWGLQVLCLNLFISVGIGKELAPIPVYCICVPVNFLLVRFVFNRI